MSPEERREDAEEAAREWRDEQRAEVSAMADTAEQRYERHWVDTGSGPGFSMLVPRTV